MLKHWQFWFTIIGAVVSGFIMFQAQKDDIDQRFDAHSTILMQIMNNDVAQSKDISYIKDDVKDIKRTMRNNHNAALSAMEP